MESVKAALTAISADGSRAAEILAEGVKDPDFVRGLAVFVVAALAGLVIDPEDL